MRRENKGEMMAKCFRGHINELKVQKGTISEFDRFLDEIGVRAAIMPPTDILIEFYKWMLLTDSERNDIHEFNESSKVKP
jgi:hypothetical protein